MKVREIKLHAEIFFMIKREALTEDTVAKMCYKKNDTRELRGTKQYVQYEEQHGRREIIVEESLVSQLVGGKTLVCQCLKTFFDNLHMPHPDTLETPYNIGCQDNENPFWGE